MSKARYKLTKLVRIKILPLGLKHHFSSSIEPLPSESRLQRLSKTL